MQCIDSKTKSSTSDEPDGRSRYKNCSQPLKEQIQETRQYLNVAYDAFSLFKLGVVFEGVARSIVCMGIIRLFGFVDFDLTLFELDAPEDATGQAPRYRVLRSMAR
jgi:hypothetical protein